MEHIRITDKIRLEQIKLSMAQVIFDTINTDREYLQKWLPFVADTKRVEDTEAFISSLTNLKNRKDNIYSIWYKEEFAGLIGFKDTDWVNRKTEIGYWLAKKMQKKGIISNCIEKLIKYAFNSHKMHRIQIKVAEENIKSESIPLRLGFRFEGIERDGELHGNKYLNLRVYSLLKNDCN